MFNSKHYIPILKWKRAEQSALGDLTSKDKKLITPLIQFVMPKLTAKESVGKTEDEKFKAVIEKFQKKANEIPKEILEAWGITPTFIDFSLLYTTDLQVESLRNILHDGEKIGVHFIPVLHLDDDQKLKDTVKGHKYGLCLRLVCADLDDLNTLDDKIKSFLGSVELPEKSIDLLLDIKEIGGDVNKFSKYINLSKQIKNLSKWRTFTFASGAFHENLSDCKIDEENLIPRLDWTNWVYLSKNKTFSRDPSFGDYAIQHPIYKESTQFFPPTTSIKYAINDSWLVMKGKKLDFKLYLANADILSKDKRFYGENFSQGDKYITEKAKHFATYAKDPKIGGTGSTETWLTAGINHHLALVVNQIANLS